MAEVQFNVIQRVTKYLLRGHCVLEWILFLELDINEHSKYVYFMKLIL